MIPGAKYKIMLIEDECSSNQKRHLERIGYDVESSKATSAIGSIAAFWPDMIVLTQPDDTGIEELCAKSTYFTHMRVVHCHE